MNNNFNKAAEYPREQFAISKSDTVNIPQAPVIICALTAGTLTIVDMNDTAITYTLAAGQLAPVLAKRVNATSSTATCVGLR